MKTKDSPWVEKYRPKKINDVKGQDEAITKLRRFLATYKISKKKAVLLHGAPGIGKTSLAHAVAKGLNYEIFELNASDLRNKKEMQTILKPALQQKSLIKENKLILIDEADGVSGMKDRGGLSEILNLISTTSYPIIITANNAYHKKLSALRKKTELIELKNIDYKIINTILFSILEKEDLFLNANLVTSIGVRSKGDLRAAINDLQAVSRTRDPEMINLDERNKEVTIFNALKKVFKEKATNETLGAYNEVNMQIDEIILWVEENIPEEYEGVELAKAYEALAQVDLFKGRIYKQQYWRFLVYENIFLSFGIAASKKQPKAGFTSYKKPSRILKIWLNNQKTVRKKSIAAKYAKLVHIGQKRAMQDFYFLKEIIKSNINIQKQLRLSDEELEYVMR
jgi:replication factor C large subunit